MQVSRLFVYNKPKPVYIPTKKESKQKIAALLRKEPTPDNNKTSK
jgi:hypothetical protein